MLAAFCAFLSAVIVVGLFSWWQGRQGGRLNRLGGQAGSKKAWLAFESALLGSILGLGQTFSWLFL
jgi:uncharacterized iron-regulated membrane protein